MLQGNFYNEKHFWPKLAKANSQSFVSVKACTTKSSSKYIIKKRGSHFCSQAYNFFVMILCR